MIVASRRQDAHDAALALSAVRLSQAVPRPCRRANSHAVLVLKSLQLYRAEDASSTLEEISYVSAVHCGFEATKQFLR